MSDLSNPTLQQETLAARYGVNSDDNHGAVIPPLYLSSNFSFKKFGEKREYDYTRSGNPTRDQLADALDFDIIVALNVRVRRDQLALRAEQLAALQGAGQHRPGCLHGIEGIAHWSGSSYTKLCFDGMSAIGR